MTSSNDPIAGQDRDLTAVMAALQAGPEILASMAPPAPDPSTYLPSFPALAAVSVLDVTISGRGGEVPGRVYRHPTLSSGTALLWVHGGGFAAGDLAMPEAHWVGLSLAARGLGVLSLDYRKCVNGVHFPAPSDDVLAGWSWAVEHVAQLGATTDRLHLGGASAGASLAAGVAKRVRDGMGRRPTSLVLLYPTLHPDLPDPSEELAAVTASLRQPIALAILEMMTRNYAGTEAGLGDPYAFPGIGHLAGLPPTYILNSEVDLLRASGEAFGAAIASAGGSVRVEHEPGSRHGHLNEPLALHASRSIERMVDWLENARSA